MSATMLAKSNAVRSETPRPSNSRRENRPPGCSDGCSRSGSVPSFNVQATSRARRPWTSRARRPMKGVGSPRELLERLIDQIVRDGDGEVHHRDELLVDGRVVHLGLLGHLPGGDGAEAVLLEHVDGGVDEDFSNVIFDFVEVFYNRQRRHSMPGYVSPVEFKLSLSEQQTVGGFKGWSQRFGE